MVLEVLRHLLAAIQPLIDLGVRDVARDDHRPREGEPRLNRVLAELREYLGHRAVEVNLDHAVLRLATVPFGNEPAGSPLQLLEPDAIPVYLRLDVAVRRARNAHPNGARGSVARQPHHAHVEREVLPAELSADPGVLRGVEQLALEVGVAERLSLFVALGRESIQVSGGGELHGHEGSLGRGSTDHERQVVGRTRRRPQRLHLRRQERDQAVGIEQRLGLLEQVGLVGRPPTLSDEQEPVLHSVGGQDVDLGRQVVARVLLVVDGERDGLRVAQILPGVRVDYPLCERGRVIAAGPHLLPLLGIHGGRARVLTEREHHLGCDLGVAQHGKRHPAVVVAGLRVIQDGRHLLEMGRPQQEGRVPHGLPREQLEPLAVDLEHVGAVELSDGHVVRSDQPVRRIVPGERERILVCELRHRATPPPSMPRAVSRTNGAGGNGANRERCRSFAHWLGRIHRATRWAGASARTPAGRLG